MYFGESFFFLAYPEQQVSSAIETQIHNVN